jgi:phospholipid/cholesterol/gamma-HCH transport system ATP-binding protein
MSRPPDTKPYVQVENLVARYGNRTVLDDVSLTAYRGEITVVLGSSGCGKSTLLRHIVGLLTPVSGRVLIDGQDFHRASEDEQEAILRNIGMSFQAGALFNSMTLEENIALPIIEHAGADSTTARTLARMKLALVGLEHAAHLLPSEISGGMKKRAAVARALALDPQLLLFDELSAGLDPVTARELDELVLRLKAQLGVAIIVVTHELSSIQMIADQAVMLHAGKVIAAGPLEQVQNMDQPQVRAFFDRRPRQATVQQGLLDTLIIDGG